MPFSPVEWPVDSQVMLCKVPWDASYKDVVYFATEDARNDYFRGVAQNGVTVKIKEMTYLKPREPVTVNVPYSQCYQYNYLTVENPKLPVPGEVTPPILFYFISNVSYVAPNTTALELQLDVWTTYVYRCRFGTGFLERGHLPMKRLFDENRRDVHTIEGDHLRRYASVPEGLDIGNEYLCVNHEWKDISNPSGGGWRVIITSTVNLAADWGSKTSPNLECADGQQVDGLISGCNMYMLDAENFKQFMEKVKQSPWVAKGIVDITCFPSGLLTDAPDVELGGIPAKFLGETPDETAWFETGNIWQQLSNGIPREYHWMHKFFTYPYSCIEWTNYQGNPLMLKPELCSTIDGNMQMFVTACAANPGMRVAVWPLSYGFTPGISYTNQVIRYDYATMTGIKQAVLRPGNNLDNAVWFQGFPKFTLVNDEGALSIAQRVNSLNASYAGAGWANAKSNATAQLGYSQTMQALDTAQQNKNIENQAAIANGALSAIGSLASGSVGGALMGAAGTGVNLYASNAQFANTQNLTASQATQNYQLAQWANKGDYEQQLAVLNASVQDAALTQPSIVGQAGGDGFNLTNGYMGIEVRYKVINADAVRVIGDYWGKYGYACRECVNMAAFGLHQMQYYTYWKFTDIYIENASCAESDKDAIRGIFSKGVTVWRNPDEIGTVMPYNNRPQFS